MLKFSLLTHWCWVLLQSWWRIQWSDQRFGLLLSTASLKTTQQLVFFTQHHSTFSKSCMIPHSFLEVEHKTGNSLFQKLTAYFFMNAQVRFNRKKMPCKNTTFHTSVAQSHTPSTGKLTAGWACSTTAHFISTVCMHARTQCTNPGNSKLRLGVIKNKTSNVCCRLLNIKWKCKWFPSPLLESLQLTVHFATSWFATKYSDIDCCCFGWPSTWT